MHCTCLAHTNYLARGDEADTAWHIGYKCAGIKLCGYRHPDLLGPRQAYDEPTLDLIQRNAMRLGRRAVAGRPIEARLAHVTEKYVMLPTCLAHT
jgi:hypothetical protein